MDNIAIFIKELFVKFGSMLPESPFDLSAQTSALNGYLGHINYFIPFYILKNIFNVWLVAMFASFGIYIFIKFLRNLLGK